MSVCLSTNVSLNTEGLIFHLCLYASSSNLASGLPLLQMRLLMRYQESMFLFFSLFVNLYCQGLTVVLEVRWTIWGI